MQVTQNCSWALKQVRLHCAESFVWIDSVCIIQDDTEEKGRQVFRMGDIFTKARVVNVSLDGLSDDSASLCDNVRWLKTSAPCGNADTRWMTW